MNVSTLRRKTNMVGNLRSVAPDLLVAERIPQILTEPSCPAVTKLKAGASFTRGRNVTVVTFFKPGGLAILVLSTQVLALRSHHQIFRYTSPRKPSTAGLESTVASQSPESEVVANSTRLGSSAFSSLRETRLVGDTSSSEMRVEVRGE